MIFDSKVLFFTGAADENAITHDDSGHSDYLNQVGLNIKDLTEFNGIFFLKITYYSDNRNLL